MAIDEGLAHLLREDLAGERITEKKMFGGLRSEERRVGKECVP